MRLICSLLLPGARVTFRAMKIPRHLLLTLLATMLLAGCAFLPLSSQDNTVGVTLVADGQTRTLRVSPELTVADVLRQAGVSADNLDRVNPPTYNRVAEGMTITVVRVTEETVVVREAVPFNSRTVPNDGLPAGEERLINAGVNGEAEVTYRITYQDGVEVTRSEIRRVIITPAQDEVIMVGSQSDLPTVTINGTLAYIASGNAWIMQQNSANRRPLTLDGGVDGRVFDLSEDGNRLLYSRTEVQTPADGNALATPVPQDRANEPFNMIWAILDTRNPDEQPLQLDLQNVLFAAWVPGTERTIVYSTAEPRTEWPGWQANNDLWRAQISANGALIGRRQLLEESSGGIYGWYGTTFSFAPDGVTLAWVQPDAIGVLTPNYEEPETTPIPRQPTPTPISQPVEELPAYLLPARYDRLTLATFAPWNGYDFIWVPTPIWSPDGALLTAVIHGGPIGNEQPEDSPLFSVNVFAGSGDYSIQLVPQAGMWAEPRYSPDNQRLAYLQAVTPLDSSSLTSRYRLVLMDADGSNRQQIFPPEDQPGLRPQQYVWSPDGTQLAVVSPGPEGNILIVDAKTGFSQQITSDGQSSSPQWSQ